MRVLRTVAAVVLCAAILQLQGDSAPSPTRPTWEEAMRQGQPRTALKLLEPVYRRALRKGDYPTALRLLGQKIALEGVIQGNKPEERIVRLEAEMAKAPQPMQPVLEVILADWYWQFFRRNRWRFVRRTTTGEPPGDDILTWDLPRILAEIDKHFTAALAAEADLKNIPVAQYNALLERGNVPDTYRPTLYDFIAFEALKFYAAGEQAGAQAEDEFVLKADSPIFAAPDRFLKWTPQTTDADSLTRKAIRLYQAVMRFHRHDRDPAAFADADLGRLKFGYDKAVGEAKDDRYKAALKRFVAANADHPTSARARAYWATMLRREDKLVEAHKVATQGENAFPDSRGGRRCHNLIQQLEAKRLQLAVERVWNEPWPTIEVRYRNLTRVHFRILRTDWTARMKRARYGRPERVRDQEHGQLLDQKPVREWTVDLPPTHDYRERVEETPAPKGLKPGFYFLLARCAAGPGAKTGVVYITDFWVSELALVIRREWGRGRVEGLVLTADSGEPVRGARVQAWVQKKQRNHWELAGTTTTNANGRFVVEGPWRSVALLATHDGQQLAARGAFDLHKRSPTKRADGRTIFFTGRSLYRPGQTIDYKGICVRVNHTGDDYSILASESVTVAFLDGRGREITRHTHRTNDYGSFSGSFTAPRDRLTGQMTIRVKKGPAGYVQFRVEEYKRPTFQVTLDAPKPAPKLQEKVSLQGKALAYTGGAIDGAKVRWRVVRRVRYPEWRVWRCWWLPLRGNRREIARGVGVTGADGAFTVEFVAKPDVSVAEKDEPVFLFTVHADVTDTTGETRSAQQTTRVGYTALAASLSVDEWQTNQNPVTITVSTTTLDGEGRPADCLLKIHRLEQPAKTHRARLEGDDSSLRRRRRAAAGRAPKPDPSNPNSWELGEVVVEEGFNTDAEGNATRTYRLAPGPYRAVLTTQDRFGKEVTALVPLTVLDPRGKKLPLKVPNLVAAPKRSLEPGEDFTLLWGTGYDRGRAFIEIEHRHKLLQAFWTEPGATQQVVRQAVTEALRGGFTVRTTMVRENRAYLTSERVEVPWSNKRLTVAWEHFVSKLEPGRKETWTAVVKGPDAKKTVAEMVATLYDESLDAYYPHRWRNDFGVFYHDYSRLSSRFENRLNRVRRLQGKWPLDYREARVRYRRLPPEVLANLWGYPWPRRTSIAGRLRFRTTAEPESMKRRTDSQSVPVRSSPSAAFEALPPVGGEAPAAGNVAASAPNVYAPDLSRVSARKRLNETAFFFPHLKTDAGGVVKLEFTMPEALTTWKFLGFAHDRELRAGLLTAECATAKDLMVQPNPPRFLREGDVLEFTVKVSNQSATVQRGAVRLTFSEARTSRSVDAVLGNVAPDKKFEIPAGRSRSFSWRVTVPDGLGPVVYKAVGSTGRLSDGEEGILPVLSRRILVTESLALPIRGPQTKTFAFTKLLQAGKSNTLRHQSLTVQLVSNPSWYAVMALPYLMEYPYGCSEQVFNRFYANALAEHIAQSDPEIRRVFDLWKTSGGETLNSPLEKNQDLKAVLLEETPWVRQAHKESEARRGLGLLFADNRLKDETARSLFKLKQMQLPDGAWPWFPGGRGNDYLTLYITTGFGRMRHLGVKVDLAPAMKSLNRLDGWIDKTYRNILKSDSKNENHLTPALALYLYGRSFFLADRKIPSRYREAVDYFLRQARTFWLDLTNRQSQAHLAVALKRFGDGETPKLIMRSIRERAVSNEERGMFWRDSERSWWWYRAPIETQAMMIEAFAEVMNDRKAVEACKVWLLKQKQTLDWKTTKATADAIYALLLHGENLLTAAALVDVSLGGRRLEPTKVEAGTGFFERRFTPGEITPKLGEITVRKRDEGVAWGSVHWQYLETLANITPHEGTPLTLTKRLYVKRYTKKGAELNAVKGPVAVGDELVVRLVLKTDRDMEYVHLKDHRGSGTEPVNVLSRYRYQDGLAYSESTKDTATHFFIDYLPKGTYVLEYSTRVVHRGRYQTGRASIQSMYAPEFNSHSESVTLEVR